MKSISKIAAILTKIIEVVHWVAAALMTGIGVCCVAAPQWLQYLMSVDALKEEREIAVYGFEVTAANAAGEINHTTLLLFAIGAVLIYLFMAMIFRNLNLIIKKAESSTPFQPDNIRMLKEIGIFSIAIPVVGLILSIITHLVIGADAAEISVNMYGFAMGVVVLCLTQYFIHGAELEQTVEGLL